MRQVRSLSEFLRFRSLDSAVYRALFSFVFDRWVPASVETDRGRCFHAELGVLLRRKALGLAILHIDLSKPLACLDKLNNVKDLLNGHDGEADAG